MQALYMIDEARLESFRTLCGIAVAAGIVLTVIVVGCFLAGFCDRGPARRGVPAGRRMRDCSLQLAAYVLMTGLAVSSRAEMTPRLDQDSSAVIARLVSASGKNESEEGSDRPSRRVRLAWRLGAAGPASGGLLGGLDLTIPTLRVSPSLVGRLDYDSWTQIDFLGSGGSNVNSYSITVNQLTSSSLSGRSIYGGAGIGYAHVEDNLRDHDVFALKLIGGANLTSFLALEATILVTQPNVVYGGLIRFRF
jgi:hypothetical protein